MEHTTAEPGSMEDALWPYIVYFTIAYISAPLYIMIIVGLIRRRRMSHFSNTFYTLVISQGFADLFYILCYTLFIALSLVGTIEDIGPFFKWTMANISYKALYYSLSLRCFGVTLISFQRYICICRWNTVLNEKISTIPPKFIALIHWAGSLLFIIPILTTHTIRFGCVCKRLVAIDPSDFAISTINAEVIVLLMFLLCVFFYAKTLHHIFNRGRRCKPSNWDVRKRMVIFADSSCSVVGLFGEFRKEVRLCIPVAVLVTAFFLIFIYHCIQMVSIIITGDQLRPVRVLEPLFTGCLTFITPWSLLFFNAEVSSMFQMKALVIPMKKSVWSTAAEVSTRIGRPDTTAQ